MAMAGSLDRFPIESSNAQALPRRSPSLRISACVCAGVVEQISAASTAKSGRVRGARALFLIRLPIRFGRRIQFVPSTSDFRSEETMACFHGRAAVQGLRELWAGVSNLIGWVQRP